ncbi:GH3 auxin-responsive promoter family protein, partial [Thermodesulfobacteriota bacterium]
HSEAQKDALFEDWKNTKAAEHICKGKPNHFDEIPATSYKDYPVLKEFGEKIEALEASDPRDKEKESSWEYYQRLSRGLLKMLDGWLPDEFGFPVKTTGTTGNPKWYVHGKTADEIAQRNIIALFVMACADKSGTTKLRPSDRLMGLVGPAPYMGGMGVRGIIKQGFTPIPELKTIDNVSDMRRRMMMTLKMIEKEGGVDAIGGIGVSLQTACRYFTDPVGLFKDNYQSMNFGIIKIIMYLMYLYKRMSGNKYEAVQDVLHTKGMVVSGFDPEMYVNYLIENFEVNPFNVYGSSECCISFLGRPERFIDLIPALNASYFEFLDENGEIKKTNQLEKGKVYEFVLTPFRSVLIRYKIGDLFRVIDFMDDGMPVLKFESRVDDILDIHNYYRMTTALANKIMISAGLSANDKWAFLKEIEPEDHLVLLMEKEWDYSEKEASKRVFDVMLENDEFFNNYVKDYRIQDHWKVIKVEYLSKGAFMRYVLFKIKQGSEMGQMKPTKVIGPQQKEIADLLRKI